MAKKNVIEQMIGILRTPIAQRKGIAIPPNECAIWAKELERYLVIEKEKKDQLETKGVDLNESARYYLLHEHISPLNEVLHQADLKVEMQYHKDIEDAYKAGFELGLKAKGE